VRFLALGDSYTIGEGVREHERWPVHLATMLRANGIDVGEPELIARTAWTSDELADAMADEKPKGPYDLVTLLVGVNDQYRSRPVSSFVPEFETLLKRAVSLAKRRAGRVIAISIPDWGATPFAEGRDRELIAKEIGAYNAQAQALAAKAGVHWVDVTGITRAMLEEPELVAPDGLHPSGEMYRRWAEHLLPIALSALGSKTRSS